jgi:3-phosphoshikimate 1-carboxyvinyltransferase
MVSFFSSSENTLSSDVTVPSSKPELQRAVLIAALTAGKSEVVTGEVSYEVKLMIDMLKQLGASFFHNQDGTLSVRGIDPDEARKQGGIAIDAGGSALVARVAIALCCAIGIRATIDGDDTLRNRPMGELGFALERLGANLKWTQRADHLPVAVSSDGLRGGIAATTGTVSSEFTTALIFASLFCREQMQVAVTTRMYSEPYVALTCSMLAAAGIDIARDGNVISVMSSYRELIARKWRIEGDWTEASYILGACVARRAKCQLRNVTFPSEWGESIVIGWLQQLGAHVSKHDGVVSVDCSDLRYGKRTVLDLSNTPNIFPTIAACGVYLSQPLTLTGLRLLRFHKCDRVSVMCESLRKLGGMVVRDEHREQVTVSAGTAVGGVTLKTNDHRIAKALIVASLRAMRPNQIIFEGDASIMGQVPAWLGATEEKERDSK